MSLLDGVAKFELEALDPVELRALLISVLDGDEDEPGEGVLDYGELNRIAAEEQTERDDLEERLGRLSAGWPDD